MSNWREEQASRIPDPAVAESLGRKADVDGCLIVFVRKGQLAIASWGVAGVMEKKMRSFEVWLGDLMDDYQERAGIMEFDGKLSHEEAERAAMAWAMEKARSKA